ncbi:MAG: c-type cytochrome [Minwuia sp.]|uniref:c-type cytochrome n=1 Tax=Minwuia sp. TaxID=2493630 RepID=UPI003A898525
MRSFALALSLVFLSLPALADDGDPQTGEEIFMRFCKQCHMPIPGDPLAAPKLNGIIGRPVGVFPGYEYSDAFNEKKAEGMIWTEQNLRDFLRDPRGYIPGSIMVFEGLKRSSHRDDIIAFIRTLPEKE